MRSSLCRFNGKRRIAEAVKKGVKNRVYPSGVQAAVSATAFTPLLAEYAALQPGDQRLRQTAKILIVA
ncbi:hypothetical protein [Pantoea sp. ACRSB]|uniref:hypothetical protein n=1 Tax=Pantoea sp. ACRSB TaxID=2918207 RepID=UPI0028934E87|nr:hypothetical protein [Pantoea sp. ACRSB]MCG7389733.1 hypothetical protein [Pantoea sp. ACRSB]